MGQVLINNTVRAATKYIETFNPVKDEPELDLIEGQGWAMLSPLLTF